MTISATDTLAGVASSINNLNTGSNPSGVTASVINFGTNDYRLILTSDKTGAEGINLLNGSSANLVQAFGWKDNQAATIKNSITLGAQSDRFTSSNVAVGSLLGLTTGGLVSVTIGDKSVGINLATMSLTDIKTAINTAAPTGVSASVIEETVDNVKYYRLQIDGTQTFSDTNNVLNTLGVLDHGSANVSGKVSGQLHDLKWRIHHGYHGSQGYRRLQHLHGGRISCRRLPHPDGDGYLQCSGQCYLQHRQFYDGPGPSG